MHFIFSRIMCNTSIWYVLIFLYFIILLLYISSLKILINIDKYFFLCILATPFEKVMVLIYIRFGSKLTLFDIFSMYIKFSTYASSSKKNKVRYESSFLYDLHLTHFLMYTLQNLGFAFLMFKVWRFVNTNTIYCLWELGMTTKDTF